MEFVKCPQCNGCKDHTANHECRKTCFAYKVAAARQQEQIKKRQQIKKAQASDKLYDAYESEAVERMKQRDWRYSRRKRRRES